MFVFRHVFVRSHVYPTVSLIKSTNWKNSICLQTLKVDANDRSAQELQNGLYNGFILNFWLRYDHFNIIQFYITKDYLVTFYNNNIGKKPRLVRWNPWVENIYGARWYPTTRTYARFEPCGSAAGYPYVPGRYMSSFFRSWFSIRNHEFLGLSNLFTGFKKKLNIFRYICQGTVTGSTAATYVYARATRKCIHSCTEQMYTHISDNGLIMYTQFRSCTEQMYTQLYCFWASVYTHDTDGWI